MTDAPACFKAYDIRGRIPDELDADLARRIGRAYADWLRPANVVVGHDVRLTSPELTEALADGLMAGGANVHHLGQCGTEEVYFATFHYAMDGGIMVTASHNPPDYNGMKLVREQARPISGDSGLHELGQRAVAGEFAAGAGRGRLQSLDHRADYLAHLLGSVDCSVLQPLTIVSDPGNGGAGVVVDGLAPQLPFEFVRLHHEPDGHFPNGVPNPILPENRAVTAEAVVRHGADMGLAWDGDFDRCFFFDANGRFLEGYYLVGLLAEVLLERSPGAPIVHDPRLTWTTLDVCAQFGGVAVQSKTGHAFIKERMRREDAVYGGEMSAHHYFRDFAYCDSGMLPWLLVAERMARSGKTLAQLVDERVERYPASGEINRRLADAAAALRAVEERYAPGALKVEHVDGLSVEFADWRFNLRSSNTEPVVRLNVESRGDPELMRQRTDELLAFLDSF